jgi:hypothetical protein
MSLAAAFFAIKVVIYMPTLAFDVRLVRKYSLLTGKVLYSLKMALLVVYVAFQIGGAAVTPDEECGVFQVSVPQAKQCTQGTALLEFVLTFFYLLFSSWVILSVMHWVRRGHLTDPSARQLLDRARGVLQRRPNAIVSNHLKHRPLVHSSKLQQQKGADDMVLTTEAADDDPRVTAKQRDIHVNLKLTMNQLQKFKIDS